MKKIFTATFISLILLLYSSAAVYSNTFPVFNHVGGDQLTIVTEKASSDKMQADAKYILFNNLDPFWATYIEVLENTDYAGQVAAVNFSTAWFEENNIEDYDVFFFPMGQKALNAADESGTKVIDKMNEILDAGKKLFITGRNIYAAQQHFQDETVGAFLSERMGTEYIGRQSLVDGNTINYFWAKGHPADPVSISSRKFCNGTLTHNDQVNTVVCETPESGYIRELDLFKTKDEEKYMPVDHFIWEQNDMYDERLIGIKIHEEEIEAKAVMWSLPFESFCSPNSWVLCITYGMKWLLQSGPNEDGPDLTFDVKTLDFGSVVPGESKIRSVNVMNVGNEELQIDGISFAQWAPDGVFEVVEGDDFPLTLGINQQHEMRIRFSPEGEDDYREYLDFESNDEDFESLELVGIGGTGSGPKITVPLENNMLEFGEQELNNPVIRDITVTNTGDEELWLRQITLQHEDDPQKIFDIVMGGQWDTYIQPSDSKVMKIQFRPVEEKTYTDSILIWSNARNAEYLYIPLQGTGAVAGSVDEENLQNIGFEALEAYPNPFNESASLHFVIGGKMPKNVNIYLSSQSGKKVQRIFKGLLSPGEYHEQINAKGLASGSYYVVVETASARAALPVVISK